MKLFTGKRLFWVVIIVFIGIFSSFGLVRLNDTLTWKIYEEAIALGGYPWMVGMKSLVIIPCVTSGYPPVCAGGTMCYTLDPARCTLYNDVTGMPGSAYASIPTLFLKTDMLTAGSVAGGNLIAGGISTTMMDPGPFAGPNGCFDCVAAEPTLKRKLAMLYDMVMAGFKE